MIIDYIVRFIHQKMNGWCVFPAVEGNQQKEVGEHPPEEQPEIETSNTLLHMEAAVYNDKYRNWKMFDLHVTENGTVKYGETSHELDGSDLPKLVFGNDSHKIKCIEHIPVGRSSETMLALPIGGGKSILIFFATISQMIAFVEALRFIFNLELDFFCTRKRAETYREIKQKHQAQVANYFHQTMFCAEPPKRDRAAPVILVIPATEV